MIISDVGCKEYRCTNWPSVWSVICFRRWLCEAYAFTTLAYGSHRQDLREHGLRNFSQCNAEYLVWIAILLCPITGLLLSLSELPHLFNRCFTELLRLILFRFWCESNSERVLPSALNTIRCSYIVYDNSPSTMLEIREPIEM